MEPAHILSQFHEVTGFQQEVPPGFAHVGYSTAEAKAKAATCEVPGD